MYSEAGREARAFGCSRKTIHSLVFRLGPIVLFFYPWVHIFMVHSFLYPIIIKGSLNSSYVKVT